MVSFLGFSIVYRKWSVEAWQYPISYQADHLAVHFYTRMYSTGQLIPFLSKSVPIMNAPNGVDLSDLPNNEDILYYTIAVFQKFFGQFFGANLAVVALMILNGLSFYLFLTYYGIRNNLSTAGGVLVALSHFMLLRGFEHVMLIGAWFLPFMLIISDWCFNSTTVWTKNKKIFTGLVSLTTGLSFPYYTFIFGQFLFFGAIKPALQKKGRLIVAPMFAIALSIFGLALGQIDTFLYRLKAGPNTLILTRDLSSIEQYSMKIADLFLPYTHLIKGFQNWAHKIYYDRPFLIHTEPGFSYLGLIGCLAFVYAIGIPIWHFFRGKKQEVDSFWLYLYWLVGFSISGGLNFLISIVAGMYLFRCTNRYSILVLIISLFLFFRKVNPHWGRQAAIALICIALIDLPARTRFTEYAEIKNRVDADRDFVSKIEKNLPAGAMIFQLPVVDFPEYPKLFEMTDYEHFRPVLYSSQFRWSYASMKGRPDNDWQKEAERKSITELVLLLREKGFSAIYLNKRGFADRGQKMMDELKLYLPSATEIVSDDLYLIKI